MERTKIESVRQLPVIPLTIEDMTWNKTGTWRLLTPKIQRKISPCRAACPISQPIADFIQAVSYNEWNKALELLLEVNPLPGVTGRLCFHPCQVRCVRKEIDQPISIRELEKHVSDLGTISKIATKARSGPKVAVCGAGPAGLSAAYHLALRDCQVTLLDPGDQVGAFLRNVSSEKLPPEVLEREINRLVDISGVLLRMNAVGLNSVDFDLAIVDRTAYQPGSEEALALEALAAGEVRRLDIETQNGPATLRPVQVAQAVALGRWAASEACLELNINHSEKRESRGGVVSKEDIKFHLLSDIMSAGETRPEIAANEEPVEEAKRCLSCGTCNLCQSCVAACPDSSCKLDEEQGNIVFDLYHCKGCGICAYECPRSALTMEGT